MEDNMFVPKSVITRIVKLNDNIINGREEVVNWNVCVKIPYKGYLISLAIDSSLGDNDLKRGDFNVEHEGVDITKEFLVGDQHTLYGEMGTLLNICKQITRSKKITNQTAIEETAVDVQPTVAEPKVNEPCHWCNSTLGYEESYDWPRCINCQGC